MVGKTEYETMETQTTGVVISETNTSMLRLHRTACRRMKRRRFVS